MKRRNYQLSLKANYAQMIEHLENNYRPDDPSVDPDCKFAYICHDKDKDTPLHYHFYIEFVNPRYSHALAQEFNIPENMFQIVYSKKGIINYLTHRTTQAIKDKKHMYDKDEVISNFDWENMSSDDVDPGREMREYLELKSGTITLGEYLMSYNVSLRKMNPLSRIRFYQILVDARETGLKRHDNSRAYVEMMLNGELGGDYDINRNH